MFLEIIIIKQFWELRIPLLQSIPFWCNSNTESRTEHYPKWAITPKGVIYEKNENKLQKMGLISVQFSSLNSLITVISVGSKYIFFVRSSYGWNQSHLKVEIKMRAKYWNWTAPSHCTAISKGYTHYTKEERRI